MILLKEYRFFVIILLLILISFGLFLIYYQPKNLDRAGEENEVLVVDVSGAVKSPGVYSFTSNERVVDAIKKAGGLTKKADLQKIALEINQAASLDDEQKIYIPLKEAKNRDAAQPNVATATTLGDVININQASVGQLESLPGIGPVYAQRIVDYRSKIGRFDSPEQLLEISGIGPRTLEKIASQISL